MESPHDLLNLFKDIKEGKERYVKIRGKTSKQERRRIRAATNKLIVIFNKEVGHKAIKPI